MSGLSLIQELEQLRNNKATTKINTIIDRIKSGNFNRDNVDRNGNTALQIACLKRLETVALALIETGQSKPEHVNNDGNTALLIACSYGLENIALALIETGQSKPEHVNNDGTTALMESCLNGFENVALALIKTGQSKPEQVDYDGETALMYACKKSLENVALALIETGQSKPEQVDNIGATALMYACEKSLENVALTLIKTGQSKPEQSDNSHNTALMFACKNKLVNVALALIETGQSKPEQFTEFRYTALLLACYNSLENVALALIETGQSNPAQVNKYGYTALMYACKNGLENVALALIKTGQSNPEHLNQKGISALKIAKEKNMTRVVDELNKLLMFFIDINESGFNVVTQETMIISEHLYENPDNIVFKVRNSYFLTDIETIKEQLKNNKNIKYECKQAGNSSAFILDSNINYDPPFFSLSSILGLQGVIPLNEMKKIVDNLSYLSRLYEIKETFQKLTAIISKDFIDGGGGEGADHCQPGKETTVYKIVSAVPICGSQKEMKPSPDETKEESTGFQETKEEPTLTIMYKGVSYTVNIRFGMTIETLKNAVLNMLVDKAIIPDTNFNVKFIYKGKVITDNSVVLDSLNPDGMVGQTMQVMLSTPITKGGKKRKTKKRRKNQSKKKVKKFTKNYKRN